MNGDTPEAAAARQRQLAALLAALQAAPREHDFFAVLRRVEALRAGSCRGSGAAAQAGGGARCGSAQAPELDLRAGRRWHSLRRRGARAGRPGCEQRFFGLLGPNGPLPLAPDRARP